METVSKWTKRAALVVLLADFVHVYTYLRAYYKDEDDELVYDDERLLEDDKIVKAYSGDCAPESLVSDEEFNSAVEETLKELETSGIKTGLYPLGDIGIAVNRESIVFAGGGRAAFMQLAHPFVAAGIRQHSMLERGVSRRFYNTFKYMFGMAFGTPEEIASSARAVRGLHSKVVGMIKEDVGIFTPTSRFSAAEKNAMRFVGATLLETAVFEYELHIRLLTETEKDSMVASGPRLLALFGVKPTENDPKTWKEFRRHMSAMWRSRVLTVSETAKDTKEFLLLAPSPVYRPLLDMINWSTIVSLPPRLAKQFAERTPNWLDIMLFSWHHALIRFIYRLCPGSWRYLTAYWRMYDREHPGQRSFLSRMISSAAARVTGSLLAIAMPERDPEMAGKLVQEKRKQRIVFEKIPNSPLKI